MISAHITIDRIDSWEFDMAASGSLGAELRFNGIVRDMEAGNRIGALHYEHYEGMAEQELRRIAGMAVERFSLEALHCVHRVGSIPVGESAVVVLVRSKHRGESLQALAWFMDELKQVVPIWKVGSSPA
ncbi:molybdenum cofactor biosynthesis protein MoaE [Prosthecochloris sp. CIB 2401]|uniref:molybdenum cofactor biosynthesis protein MoaE n=1 Tax=Prosthecochloris sp. CIB 2401 TaxID=1868325 RepID=UPI00080A9C1D|nr:molybdenum cofactor biosynthesis protein MoaE [Prosthecochloris sp. CIB 2401]ANT65883.1 Molybdopterin synthase catalytic subunit [Prosthecochloris sp. CIB 2401]